MDIKSFDIKNFIDNYRSDTGLERESRRKETNEVFTPFEIIENMCIKIDDKDWADPTKIFLEPTFGNGNILLYIIWKRLSCGVMAKTAIETLYGTELMQDNVKEAKERIKELLFQVDAIVECTDYELDKLLNEHFVCTDFFDWDFENWQPIAKQAEPSQAISLF